MNYNKLNQLAKEDKNNDNFYQDFLDTVDKCKTAVKFYLSLKKENITEALYWKNLYHEHVETLKCFYGCMMPRERA